MIPYLRWATQPLFEKFLTKSPVDLSNGCTIILFDASYELGFPERETLQEINSLLTEKEQSPIRVIPRDIIPGYEYKNIKTEVKKYLKIGPVVLICSAGFKNSQRKLSGTVKKAITSDRLRKYFFWDRVVFVRRSNRGKSTGKVNERFFKITKNKESLIELLKDLNLL
jgi:hypothetical protein